MRQLLKQLCAASLSLAFLLGAGCGSGGGGGAPAKPGPSTMFMLVDTASGSDALVTARLQGIILEDDQGQRLPLSLPSVSEIVLAHPGGSSSVLQLPAPSVGAWSTMYLVMEPNSARARMQSGVERSVDLPNGVVSVLFGERLAPTTRGFAIRHAKKLELQDQNGRLRWKSTLVAIAPRSTMLKDAQVEIESVDVQARKASGRLRQSDRLLVTLDFPSSARLIKDTSNEPLSPERFLSGLGKGARLIVDGIMDREQRIQVSAAIHSSDKDDGQKSKVEGTILEILDQQKAFKLRVLRVKKNKAQLPEAPFTLHVRAGSSKIRYLGRLSRQFRDFASLRRGMFVELEFKGPARDLAVDAFKIKIKSLDRAFFYEVAARVKSIDLAEKTFVVVPMEGRLRFGKKELSVARVHVSESTLIVREQKDQRTIIGLGDVRVLDRVKMIVRLVGDNALDAELVRVLRD